MTPISRTLNKMAYQAQSRRNGPRKVQKDTVVNLANIDFPSCKGLAIKDC